MPGRMPWRPRKVAAMQLSPSAHTDTFCRDHLPAAGDWPELQFSLPALAYPDRLNCAAELLEATIAVHGAERPCLLSADEQLELRRPAAGVQPDRPGAGRGPGRRPRQPGAAARAEQPVAGRLLVRGAAGRRRGGGDHAAAAGRGADRDLRDRPGQPGALRQPVHRASWPRRTRPGCGSSRTGRDDPGDLAALAARKPAGCDGGADGRRRRRHDRVHLRHHRPAEGHHALPPRRAGDRRHVLRARAEAAAGRRVHRHAAAGLHVRPGRRW